MPGVIRHDEALRGWPVWVLVTALNAAVLSGLIALRGAERGVAVPAEPLLLTAWVGVALYFLFGRTRIRARSLALALPLPARRLWLGHVTAVALVAAAVALASLAAELAQLRMLAGRVTVAASPAALVAHLVVGVVLATLLLQAPAPALGRIPFTAGYAFWAIVVLAAVPGLLVLLFPVGPVSSLIVLAFALALGAWELPRLPRCFSLVPRSPARAPEGRAAPAAASIARGAGGPGSRGIVARALLRGVSAGALDWMSASFTLVFAVVVGGGLTLLARDAADLRYVYVPLLSYMLFSAIGPRLGRLHHLDPLPIPRRWMFALLVAPCFAACLAGYGLGALASGRATRHLEIVDFTASDRGYAVTVPMWARRIAWDGRPPAAVSPGGESHAATVWPLWRGSRAVLYSPFSTPRGSSREFVAWQLSRAVAAVYGARIPAQEIAERHLATAPDGRVVPRMGSFRLRPDHPGLRSRAGGPMFAALMAPACILWLLLVALLLRAYRAGVPDARRQGMIWVLLALVVTFFGAQIATVETGFAHPWLASALVEISVQALGTGAVATAAVWLGGAVLLYLAYRVAERQFLRMEIPTRPTKFTLIDLARTED